MTKKCTSYVLIIETLKGHPKREVHKVISSNLYARPAYLVQLLYPIQTLDLLLFRLELSFTCVWCLIRKRPRGWSYLLFSIISPQASYEKYEGKKKIKMKEEREP